MIGAYLHPGVVAFYSTTLWFEEGWGGDGVIDRVRLLPCSVKLSAGAWIPPPVTAQRVSALCFSAFLGQDDHRAAAHTQVHPHRQTRQ